MTDTATIPEISRKSKPRLPPEWQEEVDKARKHLAQVKAQAARAAIAARQAVAAESDQDNEIYRKQDRGDGEDSDEDLAADLLLGAEQIGAFVGMNAGQIYYQHGRGTFEGGTWKLSDKVLAGSRKKLRAWMARRVAQATAEAAAKQAEKAAKDT
jgi:hypothetical protein